MLVLGLSKSDEGITVDGDVIFRRGSGTGRSREVGRGECIDGFDILLVAPSCTWLCVFLSPSCVLTAFSLVLLRGRGTGLQGSMASLVS